MKYLVLFSEELGLKTLIIWYSSFFWSVYNGIGEVIV